jgi:hypothetical protein
MLVRIRFTKGPRVLKKRRKTRRFATAAAALLTPAAVMAAVVGAWRIAADLNWADSFAIPSGFFSHWQVWLGGALLLQVFSHALNRYGKSGDNDVRS